MRDTPLPDEQSENSWKAERAARRWLVAERRAKIEAARLRVVLDKRLGEETPEWIRKLATEQSSDEERRDCHDLRKQARAERRVQVEAAKLRVSLDRRFGRRTPDWVLELAAEEP
jgi:hypothetical protein